MNVYLSGMIGSGKTTIGSRVSEALGLPFVDLDQEMDRRLGHSFHVLVRERGWLPFRELEYDICRDFATMRNHIVCLGGGTTRYRWNRDALTGSGVMVLFVASPETLIERVRLADRPRVNPNSDLESDVQSLWRDHGATYRAAADYTVDTDGATLDDEVFETASIVCCDSRLCELPIDPAVRARYTGG